MFQEEKKMLAELKVLRLKLDEIGHLHTTSIHSSDLKEIRQLDEKKHLIIQRIKEIESSLYPDVIA